MLSYGTAVMGITLVSSPFVELHRRDLNETSLFFKELHRTQYVPCTTFIHTNINYTVTRTKCIYTIRLIASEQGLNSPTRED
jgi:hypothetical protein